MKTMKVQCKTSNLEQKKNIFPTEKKICSVNLVFSTTFGCWYGKLLLFSNNKQRLRYKTEIGDYMWEEKESIFTAIKHFRRHMQTQNIPLALFSGQKSDMNATYGHVWVGVLYKQEIWEIVVKDSLPENHAGIPKNIQIIAKSLGIRSISLASQLVEEEERTGLNCIQEGYRVIGDVLDGRSPPYLLNFVTRRYDVFTRKYAICKNSYI